MSPHKLGENMTAKTKISPTDEKLILPNYIQPITGRRARSEQKVKIPTYNELPKVKGKFINAELPGTGITFPFRAWKGPIMNFSFMDGCEYTIPRVLADHLNSNCAYKKFRWVTSDGIISSGKPVTVGGQGFQGIGRDFSKELESKKYRFMFQVYGDA